MLTELVANAIRSGKVIGVGLFPSEDFQFLHIEVRDRAPGIPVKQCPEADDECGRGLLLVDELAAKWGHRPAPGGKIVFAMLERAASPAG
ncbi:ATP-binding protein [Sinosporangium siamense]|uniref:ATP-binding protein n=1 Tax=Sinosporangium siamense TaxID=1367973 RepID=UPI00194F334B|nr:ATP-binding protein [Sinosporangium siamense]